MPRPRRRSRPMQPDPSESDAAPGLAAADHAHATFDAQRIATAEGDVADIGAAIVGIVDLAGPFARRRRAHADKQGYPDHRPRSQRWIGILVVDLRLPGGGGDRLPLTGDDPANAAAAFGDLDPCIALFGQPDADRLDALRRSW